MTEKPAHPAKAEKTTCVRGISNLTFWHCFPELESLRSNVITGLAHPNPSKRVASKFLYDQKGSELFEEICQQPEYYQTRTEMQILTDHGADMVQSTTGGSTRSLLIELGSGNSRKIRTLLNHLPKGTTYVPIDISAEYLCDHAEIVAREFPHIAVVAVCADFLQPLDLPLFDEEYSARVVFFPGSTLGNFEPQTQDRILTNAKSMVKKGGSLLIGTDCKKDRRVLEDAYNDRAGVTARFEMNLLTRINRELNADFDLDRFHYRGFYDERAGRIEMYLISRQPQTVTVDGTSFTFGEGESIHVENSYKYDDQTIADLAGRLDLRIQAKWMDPSRFFQIHQFVVP